MNRKNKLSNHLQESQSTYAIPHYKQQTQFPLVKGPFTKFNEPGDVKYNKVSFILQGFKPANCSNTYAFGKLKSKSYIHKYSIPSTRRCLQFQNQSSQQFYHSRPETRYSLDTFKACLTGTDQLIMESDTYMNDWMYFLDQDHNLS